MSIVSTVKEITTNVDGSRSVVLRNFDQDGKEYMVSFFAAASVDVDAVATARVADLNEQLAVAEFETLVGSA